MSSSSKIDLGGARALVLIMLIAPFHPLLEGSQQGINSIHLGQASRAKCWSARNTFNLIEIKRGPFNRTPHDSRLLSLCLPNAQSVRSKTADFVDYIRENKYDLVAITETWLQKRDDAVRVELCPTGYKLIDHPRSGRGGGGIGLLFRD